MAEQKHGKLREFLTKNWETWNEQSQRRFITGMNSSTRTIENFAGILNMFFEVAKEKVNKENIDQLFPWLQNITTTFMNTQIDVKNRYREALFFPSEASERRLIELIDSAKSSLIICVFTITNNHLRDAVKRAKDRNLNIRIISDDECTKQLGSDIQYLAELGIPTKIDENPNAHMHNKFLIIDEQILITGSFNWTSTAVSANNENLVIIDEPELVNQYASQFEALWSVFRYVIEPPTVVEEVKLNPRTQDAPRQSPAKPVVNRVASKSPPKAPKKNLPVGNAAKKLYPARGRFFKDGKKSRRVHQDQFNQQKQEPFNIKHVRSCRSRGN